MLTRRTCKVNHESPGFLRSRPVWAEGGDDDRRETLFRLCRLNLRGAPDVPRTPYFFAGAFPAGTGLRSNFPLLWAKNTHSEAASQLVVCR